jgi:hypothetical protein
MASGTAAIVAGLSIRAANAFPEWAPPRSQLLRSPAQTPLEPGFFLAQRVRTIWLDERTWGRLRVSPSLWVRHAVVCEF